MDPQKTKMAKIGENLRDFRYKHSLSQTDIASILKLDQSAVSRIESGNQHLLCSHLIFLIEIFGVDGYSILEGRAD